MRLKSLEFLSTGHWARTHREELGPRVTILLGDNEAGKSTTRRALEALLFGADKALVAPRSVAGFEFAATVAFGDGQEFRLHRRGRNLVTPAPEELAVLLAADLAGRFRDLFRLSHDNLCAEDPTFLGAQGAIGSLLFGAQTGLAPDVLARLITELEDRIAKASSSGKKSDGLGVRLATYDEERGRRTNIARFERYDQAAAARERAATEVRDHEVALETLSNEHTRLQSLLDGVATYDDLLRTREALAQLSQPHSPATPEQTRSLERHRERLRDAAGGVEKRQTDEEQARQAFELLPEPAVIVALVEEVDGVVSRVDRIAGERRSLTDEREQHAAKSRELGRLVGSLGGKVTDDVVAAATGLIRPAPVRLALQQLVHRHAKLGQAQESGERARSEGERKLAEARRAVETSPTWSVEPLERARPYAEAAAKAEDEAQKTDEALRELDADLERLARQLGFDHVPGTDRARLPHPDSKAAKALEKKLVAAADAADAAAKDVTKAERKRDVHQHKCDGLRAELGDLPTDDRLRNLRGQREAKWTELKTLWTPTFRAGSESEVHRLAAEFEALLQTVDDLVTRRSLAAESTGRLQAAEAEVAAGAQELDVAVAAARVCAETRDRLQAEWLNLWSFLTRPPDSAADWLRDHAEWLEQGRERAEAAARLVAARGRLDQELANARALAADELPALRTLASAEAVLKELKDEEKRRTTANRTGDKLRALVQAAESHRWDTAAELDRLGQDRAAWDRDWTARCVGLPLEIAAEPATVGAWLAQQTELERASKELSELAEKIERSRERIAELDAVLGALVGRARILDPLLAIPEGLAPHDAFPALREQTTRARKRRDDRAKARDQHDLARKELDQAAQVRDQRRTALDEAWAALGQAGPWTEADLDASRGRATTAEELRQELTRLGTVLDGRWRSNREGFIARLVAHNRMELEGELLALERRIADGKVARDAARRQEHDARAALEALDAAHDALAVEQAFTQSRGAVLDKAEELLRLKIAKRLLEEARSRATVEGSDLEVRASEAFAALTSDAYCGLRIEHDDDGAALVAIEASGDEKMPDQLSAGTLDQVWLAVRLAAIEQAARETPFPLILDDVFVQFDDGRTRAALSLLARLSAQVQVIVFTHHDHLVDLAREAIPEFLTVATLPRPNGSARVRTLAADRTPHPRPVLEVDATGPEEAVDEDATSGRRTRRSRVDVSAAEQVILDLLADLGGSQGKSDLLEAALKRGHDLAVDWGGAIKGLVEAGRVVQEGQKRGARYTRSD